MNESLPPPLPPGPPDRNPDEQPSANPPPRTHDANYNLIADKIGGVPNLRKKDNLYQGATVVVFLVIGVAVGRAVGEWPYGAWLGALAGLLAGVLISGAVLMVIGLFRKP